MADPTHKIEAYIGYDKKNLYIAFRAYDSEPDKIRYCVTNRDNCMEDDWMIVLLDTFNEKRRAYSFIINPIGVQMDLMRIEEGSKYIVTVGSVGQPRDYDNRACCTIYDTEAKTITYFRHDYDIEKAAKKIFESKLASNFGKRLFLGI